MRGRITDIPPHVIEKADDDPRPDHQVTSRKQVRGYLVAIFHDFCVPKDVYPVPLCTSVVFIIIVVRTSGILLQQLYQLRI